MPVKSKARFDGYLLVDHRASPGLNKPVGGLPAIPEGRLHETSTLSCAHCRAVVVMNPERVRARGYCAKCDRYICDFCEAERHKPEYVHRSFEHIVDMVQSGRYALVGGSASAPILIPTKGASHGT